MMTSTLLRRRNVLGALGGIAGIVLPARATGVCGPGTVPQVRVWVDYVHCEGRIEMPRGLGGFSYKIPQRVVKYDITCVPAPPPPPPPAPNPKSGGATYGRGGFGWYHSWNSFDMFGLYVSTKLPSFARLSANSASLKIRSTLQNGSVATHQATLVADGSGFRLGNPSAANSFLNSTRGTTVSAEMTVDDVYITATADGADNVGVDLYYQGNPTFASAQLVHAHGGRDPGPGWTDPHRLDKEGS